MHRTITVNLLNFVEVPNERDHNVYRIREDKDGHLFSDRLEIHLLELPKLQNQLIPVGRRLVRWLSFLSARTKEKMEELVKEDAVMQKAMTTLEFLSQDQQTRMLYEERQKGLHDYQMRRKAPRFSAGDIRRSPLGESFVFIHCIR